MPVIDERSVTAVAGHGPDRDRSLRVVSFTTIFPNSMQPRHGLFVQRRIEAMSRTAEVRVVAPVPWAPPVPGLPARFYRCAHVNPLETAGGLPVHHPRFIAIPGVLKSVDPALLALSCLPGMRALRRAFPFDVIDAHWACPDGVAAALLADVLNVPFAMTVRGDDLNVFAQERGRRRLIAWALRRADRVIAVSGELADHAVRLGAPRDRVAVVPNGVDTTLFQPMDRIAARRVLGIPDEGRLILSVGRLHESKGFPVLVDALARLGRGCDDVRLVILGESDSEADARPAILRAVEAHRLGARVDVRGPEQPDRLPLWYNAADLFALATTREGSANVLLEAIACGTPCVTTPVGGNRDAVLPGVSGLLCQADVPGFAAAMTEAFGRTWDRAAIRREMSRRGWDRVGAVCCEHLSAIAGRVAA
jgi:glycosyltransferase involved in cell wall biosynthesis